MAKTLLNKSATVFDVLNKSATMFEAINKSAVLFERCTSAFDNTAKASQSLTKSQDLAEILRKNDSYYSFGKTVNGCDLTINTWKNSFNSINPVVNLYSNKFVDIKKISFLKFDFQNGMLEDVESARQRIIGINNIVNHFKFNKCKNDLLKVNFDKSQFDIGSPSIQELSTHINLKISEIKNILKEEKEIDDFILLKKDSFNYNFEEISSHLKILTDNLSHNLLFNYDENLHSDWFQRNFQNQEAYKKWIEEKKHQLLNLLNKFLKIKSYIVKKCKHQTINLRESFRKIYSFYFKNLDETDSLALIF